MTTVFLLVVAISVGPEMGNAPATIVEGAMATFWELGECQKELQEWIVHRKVRHVIGATCAKIEIPDLLGVQDR